MSTFIKKKEFEKKQDKSGDNFDLKVGLFLALVIGGVAAMGVLLWRHFYKARSVQAYINSELIQIQAPISGQLKNFNREKVELGNSLSKLTQIATIESDVENPRVSDLKIRRLELEANLPVIQRALGGINQQLINRNQQLQLFNQQKQTQNNLEVARAYQNLEGEKRALEKAEALAKVTNADAKRFSQLANEGAVNVSTAERKVAEARQANAETKMELTQINQAKLNLQAANIGLQLLDGSRTLSYPEIRILELESEIIDLEQQAKNSKKQIQSHKFEIKGIQKELLTQEMVPVVVPEDGVVWSVEAQPRENVEVNTPIAQVVNCDDVWVEAFVSERVANQISIGQPVEITLEGQSRSWQGRVKTIRGGSGRVEIGEFDVKPPPEILRRQLTVRVVTVRIAVDWKKSLMPNSFCGAGLSVQTRFIKGFEQ